MACPSLDAGRLSDMKTMAAAPISVLVIEGRFYEDIADELLKGALQELEAQGAGYERVAVPGALEIPQALALACRAGLIPYGASQWRFHGCIALGCVIRGETSHYEIVARESAHALMQIATANGVPTGNGILTVESRAQAWERASVTGWNKGRGAARACLSLTGIFRKFCRSI